MALLFDEYPAFYMSAIDGLRDKNFLNVSEQASYELRQGVVAFQIDMIKGTHDVHDPQKQSHHKGIWVAGKLDRQIPRLHKFFKLFNEYAEVVNQLAIERNRLVDKGNKSGEYKLFSTDYFDAKAKQKALKKEIEYVKDKSRFIEEKVVKKAKKIQNDPRYKLNSLFSERVDSLMRQLDETEMHYWHVQFDAPAVSAVQEKKKGSEKHVTLKMKPADVKFVTPEQREQLDRTTPPRLSQEDVRRISSEEVETFPVEPVMPVVRKSKRADISMRPAEKLAQAASTAKPVVTTYRGPGSQHGSYSVRVSSMIKSGLRRQPSKVSYSHKEDGTFLFKPKGKAIKVMQGEDAQKAVARQMSYHYYKVNGPRHIELSGSVAMMDNITFCSMALNDKVTTSHGLKMEPAKLKAGIEAAQKDYRKHGILRKDNTIYEKAAKILKVKTTPLKSARATAGRIIHSTRRH